MLLDFQGRALVCSVAPMLADEAEEVSVVEVFIRIGGGPPNDGTAGVVAIVLVPDTAGFGGGPFRCRKTEIPTNAIIIRIVARILNEPRLWLRVGALARFI